MSTRYAVPTFYVCSYRRQLPIVIRRPSFSRGLRDSNSSARGNHQNNNKTATRVIGENQRNRRPNDYNSHQRHANRF